MTVLADAIGVVQQGPGGERVCGLALAERNRRVIEREGARPLTDPAAGEDLPWLLVVWPGVALDRGWAAVLPPTATAVRLEHDGAAALWGPRESVLAAIEGGAAVAPPAVLPILDPLLLDVRTPHARRITERVLLRRTGKDSDGPVSRALNRPISRAISRVFLAAGLKPIHASAVCLAIGFAAAWLAAQPTALALAMAGFLFQMASMFDGVDGEMARVTLTDSPRGALIDSAIDNLTYVACLTGLAIGLTREGIGPMTMAFIAILLLGTPLVILTGGLLVRRYGPDTSLVHVTLWLREASSRPDSPLTMRMANVVFPITRRDAFALTLMVLSFVGSRGLMVGLVAVGVALGGYIVFFHQARLIAVAQEANARTSAVRTPSG